MNPTCRAGSDRRDWSGPAILLRRLSKQGLTAQEIGELLGLTPAQAGWLMMRAAGATEPVVVFDMSEADRAKDPGFEALKRRRNIERLSWAEIGRRYGVHKVTARQWYIDGALAAAGKTRSLAVGIGG